MPAIIHDMLGGQLSGLYDGEGNAKRNRPMPIKVAHEAWSVMAIFPSIPLHSLNYYLQTHGIQHPFF